MRKKLNSLKKSEMRWKNSKNLQKIPTTIIEPNIDNVSVGKN